MDGSAAHRVMVTTADTKGREHEAAEVFLSTPSQENFKVLFELLYPKLVRYFVSGGPRSARLKRSARTF